MSTADVLGYCQRQYGAAALTWGGFYDALAAAFGVDRVLNDLLGVW